MHALTRRQFAALAAAPLFAQNQKPNFVVILVDDMGYGDIGPYGVKDIRTPALDRLAKEGVRFTDFYSNGPVCTPTRCGFITGRYQQRVGLEWALLPSDSEIGLSASEPSIARMLRGAGYATGMFGKWHLGFKTEYSPVAHGFDEFFGILGGNADMYSHKNRFGGHELYDGPGKATASGYLTELITDRAVQFIDRHAKSPFFLYVPYNAVHWPFQKPGLPGDIRNAQTWYDGTRQDYARMLEAVDTGIASILAALDKHGLAKNTMVVFTNDNGGERLSRNAPLFHHKATLWEGGIRVPCIVRWPAQIPAGKVSKQPAITMDLTATIVGAAGAAVPPGVTFDGIDLLPAMQAAKPAVVDRTLFWRIERGDRKQRAARQGKWKYVRDGNIECLYDLDTDIAERNDVSYSNRAKLEELRIAVASWEKEMDASPKRFDFR